MRALLTVVLLCTSGCTIGWGGFQATAMSQPATDVIQTRTLNALGLQTMPESGIISFGWLRSQEFSAPIISKDDKVPDISATSDINADSGIGVIDTLEIGIRADEAEKTAVEAISEMFNGD